MRAFLALDDYLKRTPWDVLVISGDLSRVGNRDSLSWARNWLNTTLYLGSYELGLGLAKQDDKLVVTVPGNHDRFNGSLTQGALDNYTNEFGAVPVNETVSTVIRGTKLNFHLYDSTFAGGGFGRGRIADLYMVPKRISIDELNIAILHHYFIQPPKHNRTLDLELDNCNAVAAYLLSVGFDAIMFGHLHERYIDYISGKLIARLLPRRRERRKVWRRLIPRRVAAMFEEDGAVSYRRERAANGQAPSLEAHYEYIFMKRHGAEVFGPQHFKTIKHFYQHLSENREAFSLKAELDRLKQKKVLISMAPSACQAEAPMFGLQRFVFRGHNGRIEEFECYHVDFDEAHFLESTIPSFGH